MPFAFIGFALAAFPLWRSQSFLKLDTLSIELSRIYLFKLFLLVVLCMIFARNAAMAFNRYIDERVDKLNPRTAQREIPAGVILKNDVLWFVLLNSFLFVASTYFINLLCFFLSPIALFVILFYSYTKRFTPLCHLVLGLGLSLAPIGAYIAISNQFEVLPILFSCVVFTWVSGFDILYALQDEEFDKVHQLKSIPVLLGRKNALLVSRILHIISGLTICFIAYQFLHYKLFYVGAIFFIGLLIYQQSLVTVKDISKVNLAFGFTNGVASVVFSVFVILSLILTY